MASWPRTVWSAATDLPLRTEDQKWNDPEHAAIIAILYRGDIFSGDGSFTLFFQVPRRQEEHHQQVGHLLDSAKESGLTVISNTVKPDFSDLNANAPLLNVVEQAGCLKEGRALAAIATELALQPRPDHHHASVGSPIRGSTTAGYRVIIVEDACSAATPEAHQVSIGSLVCG